jgi:hypothetical protein
MSTRSRETKAENHLKQPRRDPNLQRRMQDVILARLNLKAVPGILAQSSDGAEPTSHATDLTNFKLHLLRCRSMTDTPRARSFASPTVSVFFKTTSQSAVLCASIAKNCPPSSHCSKAVNRSGNGCNEQLLPFKSPFVFFSFPLSARSFPGAKLEVNQVGLQMWSIADRLLLVWQMNWPASYRLSPTLPMDFSNPMWPDCWSRCSETVTRCQLRDKANYQRQDINSDCANMLRNRPGARLQCYKFYWQRFAMLEPVDAMNIRATAFGSNKSSHDLVLLCVSSGQECNIWGLRHKYLSRIRLVGKENWNRNSGLQAWDLTTYRRVLDTQEDEPSLWLQQRKPQKRLKNKCAINKDGSPALSHEDHLPVMSTAAYHHQFEPQHPLWILPSTAIRLRPPAFITVACLHDPT